MFLICFLFLQSEPIIEGNLYNRLNCLERSTQEIKETFERKMEILESKMVSGFEAIDRNLEKFADAFGVKKTVDSGDDDEDRKRLKERLSEALEIRRHSSQVSEIGVDGFLEYFFGICKPNGRFGKHGSRCLVDNLVIALALKSSLSLCRIAGSFIHIQSSYKVQVKLRAQLPHRSPLKFAPRTVAGMLVTRTLALFYTAVIVPVQICMWNYEDPCNMFPTLAFDVIVDVFFMVAETEGQTDGGDM
jgi:hypothetical protein